jgi:hypothetical protein
MLHLGDHVVSLPFLITAATGQSLAVDVCECTLSIQPMRYFNKALDVLMNWLIVSLPVHTSPL